MFLFIEISKRCLTLQELVVASVEKLSNVNGKIMSKFFIFFFIAQIVNRLLI